MATFKQISNLKDSVAGILSGLDLSNVQDLNATLERAAANMITRAYIPEASGIQNISLYSGVYDYLVDSNIYETDLIDIRPQGSERPIWDFTVKSNQATFDKNKGRFWNGTRAAFQYNNGTPIIRIVSQGTTPEITLDSLASPTGWVASGTATTPVQDTTTAWKGKSCLRFNVTAGPGILTKTINTIDLSSYSGVGSVFLAVDIPDASKVTSITLNIGSSVSDYYTMTATTQFAGAFSSNNWQLVGFDLSTATAFGIPNLASTTYAQITINVTGTETNFRVGSLFAALPNPHQILYQSAAVFLPTLSTVSNTTITLDTDSIIFNTAAYNIYLYECALAVLENMTSDMGDSMYARIAQRLGVDGQGNVVGGLYKPYMADNPSEQIRQFNTYYSVRNNWWWGNGTAGL